jgi:hypothetical protein
MTPHEEHYPRRRAPDDGNNWGLFLLGIVAITIVGVLALTSSSSLN